MLVFKYDIFFLEILFNFNLLNQFVIHLPINVIFTMKILLYYTS